MKNVDLTDRYLFVFLVFILYIYQHIHSESTEQNQVDHRNTQSKKRQEKEIPNTYSSPKATQFLSHDKCIQRMKCPANHKEECSEECRAGNTEEEIEEHQELTMDEHRSVINNKPLPQFEIDTNSNKQSTTNDDL